MTVACHPLPRSTAAEMLQLVAKALCDLPNDNAPRRASRARQMVHGTAGFEPRDGLEFMLSSLVFGHFHLILDSMRDVLRGQMDELKVRNKTTIVSLDRALLGLIKEIRLSRKRPLARQAEDDATLVSDGIPPMDWVAEWAGLPPEPVAPEPEAAIAPEVAAAELPATEPVEPTPAMSASPGQPRAVPSPRASEDGTPEQHVAAFQDALAALAGSLAEARALDTGTPGATSVAGG